MVCCLITQEKFGFCHISLGLNFFATLMCIRIQNVVGNIPGLLRIYLMQTENNMAIMRNETRSFFTPFCCEAHFQLHHLFTPSHFWFNALWLVCFRLFKYFLVWKYHFRFTSFWFTPDFSGTRLGLQTIFRHPRNTTTYGGEQTLALFWGLALCFLYYCTWNPLVKQARELSFSQVSYFLGP